MAAMSPFEIFGLKPQFRIDKQKLDEKYFAVSYTHLTLPTT